VEIKVFARKPELHLPALVWFLSAVVSDVMITVVFVITLVSIVSVIGCIRNELNNRINGELALSLPMMLSQKLFEVRSCPYLRP
jgi:hypothetical protein